MIFTAASVLGILADRKTQTRRLISPQPEWHESIGLRAAGWAWKERGLVTKLSSWPVAAAFAAELTRHCLHGRPQDRLWVRETWAGYDLDGGRFRIEYADGAVAVIETTGLARQEIRQVAAAARRYPRWGSPRFMPRWASRLTLEITNVRVQQLQEISEEDARAEGFHPGPYQGRVNGEAAEIHVFEPRRWYAMAWDSINGKWAPWVSNPWVWAITFRRVEAARG